MLMRLENAQDAVKEREKRNVNTMLMRLYDHNCTRSSRPSSQLVQFTQRIACVEWGQQWFTRVES